MCFFWNNLGIPKWGPSSGQYGPAHSANVCMGCSCSGGAIGLRAKVRIIGGTKEGNRRIACGPRFIAGRLAQTRLGACRETGHSGWSLERPESNPSPYHGQQTRLGLTLRPALRIMRAMAMYAPASAGRLCGPTAAAGRSLSTYAYFWFSYWG